jgi:hypothetical protein
MELAKRGVIGPEETVVAVISGNGLKTLAEQPIRPWPEGVPCSATAMEERLAEPQEAGVSDPTTDRHPARGGCAHAAQPGQAAVRH